MRNEWPLATNFGTSLRVVFLCEIGLFPFAGALWGDVEFYIAKCHFIYIDDIAQQKMYMSRNLWWASRCLFLSVFKFESNYNLICLEFWHVLFPMLFFFVSRGKVLRYCCWFWLGFLDVVIYLWLLVNRGSWWDVCELIFVSPAGYVDFALSLSAGVSFQSGLLWGSMLPCTGRNFSRG